MDDLLLITPSVDWEAEFRGMAAELRAAGERYRSLESLQDDFATWVRRLEGYVTGAGLGPGQVPWSTFWLVRPTDHCILGYSSLRHYLDEVLEDVGGHIGYTIRPAERRRGYGTRLLHLTLAQSRARGLSEVLLTCNHDNVASARVIEKNGGVLASASFSPRVETTVRRYWIQL